MADFNFTRKVLAAVIYFLILIVLTNANDQADQKLKIVVSGATNITSDGSEWEIDVSTAEKELNITCSILSPLNNSTTDHSNRTIWTFSGRDMKTELILQEFVIEQNLTKSTDHIIQIPGKQLKSYFTGEFTCTQKGNTSNTKSIYVYFSDKANPFIIYDGQVELNVPIYPPERKTIVPCRVTNHALVPELRLLEPNGTIHNATYDPKIGFLQKSDFWPPISKFGCGLTNQSSVLQYKVEWKGNDVRFSTDSNINEGSEFLSVKVEGQNPEKTGDNEFAVYESDDVTITCAANASQYNKMDLTIVETDSKDRQTNENDFGLLPLINPENNYKVNFGGIFRFPVTKSSSGNYTCLALRQESSSTSIQSQNGTVQIVVKDLYINSTFPHKIEAEIGQVGHWECLVADERINTTFITWSRNGTTIEDGHNGYNISNSSQVLSLRNPNSTHAGEYKCLIYTKNGYAMELSANLTVHYPTPKPADSGLSGGAIAGIILVALVAIVSIGFAAVYFKRKYGDRASNGYSSV